MNKLKLLLVGFFVILMLFVSCTSKNGRKFEIAIVSIVEIDPIVQLREGFMSEFGKSEFASHNDIAISEYNAQNDPSLINQIVDKLATQKPNLIYVLGTPIAQAIQKRIPDVLLVQGTATDPVAAGLAKSWEGSGRNYVATTDLPPIKKQINLILDLIPNVERIGVIYNPGEINSVSVISRIRSYIEEDYKKLKLIERPISNSSEVALVTQSLLGNVDVIYLPPDNTAHSAIPVIGKLTNENDIPFFATVETAINEGALATLSLDFFVLGEETARLALRVLNGEEPGSIPITPIENPIISINAEIAKKYSIDLNKFGNVTNVRIVN